MMEQKKRYLLLLCLTFARVNGFQSPSSHNGNSNKRIRRNTAKWNSISTSSLSSLNMVSRSMTSPSSKTRDIEKQIIRLGRSGKTNEALSLYYNVKLPSTRLINSAIDACSRARPTRLEEACTILERAVEEKGIRPNVYTFGLLMNACNRARNSGKALALLRSFEVRL
jgi:hypothetical protein